MEKIIKGNGMTKPAIIVEPELCCVSCPHWFKREDLSSEGNLVGECRLKPPQLFLFPVHDSFRGQGLSLQTNFPPIAASGWCGEHPNRKDIALAEQFMSIIDLVSRESPGFAATMQQVAKQAKPEKA